MILPPGLSRWWFAAVCLLILSLGGLPNAYAGCPPGESNPISSGTGAVGAPVIFSGLGTRIQASFFILGAGDIANSGTLPPSWLVPVVDVDGDGLPEVRIEAPGDGPGGWGDPLTEGCPSTLMPPRPPLVIVLHHFSEDLDRDGRFDVFEDRNRNGILNEFDLDGDGIAQCGQRSGGSPNFESEDTDCDRRVTPFPPTGKLLPRECEGVNREDLDCDGHLDRIDEDFNMNGRLDVGEDIDLDGRLDRGIEDRNGNFRLDDRPFPDPADPRNPLCQDPSNRNPVDPSIPCSIPHSLPPGVSSPLYPYGSLVPAPGGIIVASVAWNGSAYDFDAINTPTRLVTLDDGRMFRLVEATPLERLTVRVSGLHQIGCAVGSNSRAYFELDGIDLHDDSGGARAIFDRFEGEFGGGLFPPQPLPRFNTAGNGAGGAFFSFSPDTLPAAVNGILRSAGSNGFLSRPLVMARSRTADYTDYDRDQFGIPLDLCPLTPDKLCPNPPFQPGICDADNDGIGDACDPSLDPGATVDSAWVELPLGDPGIRDGAAAVYDAARGVIVLFGGSPDTDTWEFDGAAWRRTITAVSPSPRRDHRMVFDTARGRVLLFGGLGLGGQYLSDLWQYTGSEWSLIDVVETPSPRRSFAFSYDSLRDRVVLFGGCATGMAFGDTWEFDGALWRRAPTPVSPNPMCEAEMAFDTFRGVTVLRGSFSDAGGVSVTGNQIFEFDGATWQIVDYQGDLPPGYGGGMSFDAGRRQILLIGGVEQRILTSPLPTSSTRLYDGYSWSALPTLDTPREISEQPAAFDAGRRTYVLYRENDTVDGQPDTLELRRPDDTDGDGVADPDDNCPLRFNPDQADLDDDEVGDPCDNCPGDANPRQRDVDRDRLGDACDDDIDNDGLPNDGDLCPGVFIPPPATLPLLSCGLSGSGNLDRDGDGVGDDCDRCPDDPSNDADDDGVCGDADNCPATFNPAQADGNDDGSGDACQPAVAIESIREDGGADLEVTATAEDPQGDPVSGTIELIRHESIVIPESGSAGYACTAGYFPEGIPGEGIGFWFIDPSFIYLFDLAGGPTFCNDGVADFVVASGPCLGVQSSFNTLLEFSALALPAEICIRDFPGTSGGETVVIQGFDENALQALRPGDTPSLVVPFSSGLPRSTDISSLGMDGPHLLRITATDGDTAPVTAARSFLYQGESTMLIGSGMPRAVICAPPAAVDCSGPSIGVVDLLDGSCSMDGGLGEPIVSYAWFRGLGTPGEEFLGGGPLLHDLTLPLGTSAIALRVTDSAGASDTVETIITVIDEDPPALTAVASPSQLWPPNHRLVPVEVALLASDLCDPSPSVALVSVTSSEPDDDPGDSDGNTVGDIDGAALGTADDLILLRAERSDDGTGRVYELRYLATDASGNTTPVPAAAMVVVPLDRTSGSGPLLLRVEPDGRPGKVRID